MNEVTGVQKKKNDMLNEYLSNTKNKSIFVGAVTILLFIGLTLFGIIPSLQEIISQNQENQVIEETIRAAKRKLTTIESLIEQQNESASVLGLFESAFPTDVSQEEFVEQLDALAGDFVFIQSITFPEFYPNNITDLPVVSQNVKEVEVSLKAEGTKRTLVEFVRKLEESTRVYNMRTINILRKSQEQIQEVGFEREFELSIIFEYYFWSSEPEDAQ